MRTSSIDRTAIAAANSAASSASTASVAATAAAEDAAAVASAVINVDEAAASAAAAAAAVDVATTAAATASTAATDAAASAGAASGAAATTDSVMAARVEDSGSELRGALNAAFVVKLVEDEGGVGTGYPARPAGAEVAVFVGTTNPEAFMEAADFWVNLAETPPLDEADIAALVGNTGTTLGAATRDAARAAVGTSLVFQGLDFLDISGTPNTANVGSTATTRVKAWHFDASAAETIGAVFLVPAGWSNVRTYVLWTNAGAGAGDVRWSFAYRSMTDDSTITDAATGLNDANFTAGAVGVLKRAWMTPDWAATPGQLVRFSLTRQAANAADTLANDAAVIAVVIERQS